MDENEFIKEGGIIGKCSLCSRKIRKGKDWQSTSTINISGKKICGNCLYHLIKPVNRAEKLYTEAVKLTGKKEQQIEKHGVWVNPETGRIERA